jgi:hypothetical protein
MAWDDELKQLSQSVRDVFGEDAFEDAVSRALVAMTKAQPDDGYAPFDADAVCEDALKVEFRWLLQPH